MQVRFGARKNAMTDQFINQIRWFSEGAILNASCAYFTMWSPTEMEAITQQWTFVLLSGESLADITLENGDWTTKISDANVTASCNGAKCNASKNKWVRVGNLDPAKIYFFLSAPNHFIVGGSDNQLIYFVFQAFTAGKPCNMKDAQVESILADC